MISAMNNRFLVLFFLLFISCEKNDTEVTISGKVIDAVSGSPVKGALVTLCIHYSCEGRIYTNNISGASAQSDTDGSYSINYKFNNDDAPVFKDRCNPGTMRSYPFPDMYTVYAAKTGYITSDYHPLNDNILHDADIKLYHSAQLNIHVKNEGINKTESVRVCIDRGLGFTYFGTPQYVFKCVGYNFDSILEIKDLWGGFYYICKVIPLDGPTYVPSSFVFVDKSVLLLPDTINLLSISY